MSKQAASSNQRPTTIIRKEKVPAKVTVGENPSLVIERNKDLTGQVMLIISNGKNPSLNMTIHRPIGHTPHRSDVNWVTTLTSSIPELLAARVDPDQASKTKAIVASMNDGYFRKSRGADSYVRDSQGVVKYHDQLRTDLVKTARKLYDDEFGKIAKTAIEAKASTPAKKPQGYVPYLPDGAIRTAEYHYLSYVNDKDRYEKHERHLYGHDIYETRSGAGCNVPQVPLRKFYKKSEEQVIDMIRKEIMNDYENQDYIKDFGTREERHAREQAQFQAEALAHRQAHHAQLTALHAAGATVHATAVAITPPPETEIQIAGAE